MGDLTRIGDETLPFRKLTLCAADYDEFVCSRETFEWLSTGGMASLDGVPVHLQLMDTLRGNGDNVIAKIWRQPVAA